MKAIGILAGALSALALLAPTAAAHDDDEAEIFATNNTAVITDPADPRLQDRLKGFAREVERIIDDGGARARGSELLDGVFSPARRRRSSARASLTSTESTTTSCTRSRTRSARGSRSSPC